MVTVLTFGIDGGGLSSKNASLGWFFTLARTIFSAMVSSADRGTCLLSTNVIRLSLVISNESSVSAESYSFLYAARLSTVSFPCVSWAANTSAGDRVYRENGFSPIPCSVCSMRLSSAITVCPSFSNRTGESVGFNAISCWMSSTSPSKLAHLAFDCALAARAFLRRRSNCVRTTPTAVLCSVAASSSLAMCAPPVSTSMVCKRWASCVSVVTRGMISALLSTFLASISASSLLLDTCNRESLRDRKVNCSLSDAIDTPSTLEMAAIATPYSVPNSARVEATHLRNSSTLVDKSVNLSTILLRAMFIFFNIYKYLSDIN